MRDLIGLRARLLLLLLPECDEVIEERKHAGWVRFHDRECDRVTISSDRAF